MAADVMGEDVDPIAWRDGRIAQLQAELRAEQDHRRQLELRCVGYQRQIDTLQSWMDGADRQGVIAEMILARLALARRKVAELRLILGDPE